MITKKKPSSASPQAIWNGCNAPRRSCDGDEAESAQHKIVTALPGTRYQYFSATDLSLSGKRKWLTALDQISSTG